LKLLDAVGENKAKYVKVLNRFYTEAFVHGDVNTVKEHLYKTETNIFFKEVIRIITEKSETTEVIYNRLFNAFIKSRLTTHEAFSQV
jgi:hypothetical protein